MVKEGISKRAHKRHINSENIIRKPNAFSIVSPEMKRTEKPIITENALIDIPLPVDLKVYDIASAQDLPC